MPCTLRLAGHRITETADDIAGVDNGGISRRGTKTEAYKNMF